MNRNERSKIENDLPSEIREAIETAVEMLIQSLGKRSKMNFGYNGESVEWLEGYIDELRDKGVFKDEKFKHNVAFAYGAFLGQSIVHCYGGFWAFRKEHGLCVCFPNGAVALPLQKPLKQIENGMEDGIANFFYMVPIVLGDELSQLNLPPTAEHVQLWVSRT
jgi:hypothetical protein